MILGPEATADILRKRHDLGALEPEAAGDGVAEDMHSADARADDKQLLRVVPFGKYRPRLYGGAADPGHAQLLMDDDGGLPEGGFLAGGECHYELQGDFLQLVRLTLRDG